jgi:hypothetical protein
MEGQYVQDFEFCNVFYMNPNDYPKPSKVQWLFNVHSYEKIPKKEDQFWKFLFDLLKTSRVITSAHHFFYLRMLTKVIHIFMSFLSVYYITIYKL